jgi:hypothetical protein
MSAQAQASVACTQVMPIHVELPQLDAFDRDPNSDWLHSGDGIESSEFFTED